MKEISLAQISRNFLSKHKVYRYRMVKVTDMDDQSVIRACHWYCEENNLTDEFKEYRETAEQDAKVHHVHEVIAICDECGSEYLASKSTMVSLCPECAHVLYGYENCDHEFKDGKCTLCLWDGSRSDYINKLLKNSEG